MLACNKVIAPLDQDLRIFFETAVLDKAAAVEAAALWRIDWAWQIALEQNALLAIGRINYRNS